MFRKNISILFSILILLMALISSVQSQEAYKLKINEYSIPCSDPAQKLRSFYRPFSNYGVLPQISLSANPDNTYHIAWLDLKSHQIKITHMSAQHKVMEEIRPDYIGKTKRLCGFTQLPNNQGFVLGYSKDNAHGDQDFEFWITRCDRKGKMIFNTRIFGEKPSEEVNSKGFPARAGSARIIYNPYLNSIFFYLAHTQKWKDQVRHQGGYLGKITLEGDFETINPWFGSHNFDQRLVQHGKDISLLMHGDAYPRALTFAHLKEGKSPQRKDYFTISGETGDNFTDAQTGDLVALGPNRYALVFSSGQDKPAREVGYLQITIEGKQINTSPITWWKASKDRAAVSPRIAHRPNGRLLIAYEEFVKDKRNFSAEHRLETVLVEIDENGKALSKEMRYKDIPLQMMHSMLTLANGNIIWVVASQNENKEDQLLVYEINKIENDRLFYESFGKDYQELYFSDQNGGFLLMHSSMEKEQERLQPIGEALAKKENQVRILPRSEFEINGHKYRLFTFKKLNKSVLNELKSVVRRTDNKLFYFKSDFDVRTFISELSQEYSYIPKAWKITVVSENKIYTFEKDDFKEK